MAARTLGVLLAAAVSCAAAVDECTRGRKQSPVDLPVCDSPPGRKALDITWATQDAEVVNTGSTIQIKAMGGAPGGMAFTSGWADKQYTLLHCELFYASLHTVGGLQAPLEAHCMHSKDGSDHVGGLSILFRLGNIENPFLEQIDQYPPSPGLAGMAASEEEKMEQRSEEGSSTAVARELSAAAAVVVSNLDFSKLHSPSLDRTRFFSYEGSAVSENCTENVDWYVLMGAAPLAQYQLDRLQAAAPGGGNFRVPQPLNAKMRTLYGCSTMHEESRSPTAGRRRGARPLFPYDAESWVAYTEQTQDKPSRICATGSEQSPVGLQACSPLTQREIRLTWKVPQQAERHISELGIVVTAKDPAPGGVEINGVPHDLERCHIYLGSGHTVGGVQYAVEVQCIHRPSNFQGRYVVLAVLFEVKTGINQNNDFLWAVSDMQDGRESELDFRQMIPTYIDLKNYYSYSGSDSMPPCAEDRDWYVVHGRPFISAAQHERLLEIVRSNGATERLFRPPQQLGFRLVHGCIDGAFEKKVYDDLLSLSAKADESLTLAVQLDSWITLLFFLLMITLFGLGRILYQAFQKKKSKVPQGSRHQW